MEILKPRWNWPAELDFKSVEDRLTQKLRKDSKTRVFFDEYASWDCSSVGEALKKLKAAQCTNYGEDPLFEAMERAKNLPKVGVSTLKALCTAEPLSYLQNDAPTHGPIKAKDWQ